MLFQTTRLLLFCTLAVSAPLLQNRAEYQTTKSIRDAAYSDAFDIGMRSLPIGSLNIARRDYPGGGYKADGEDSKRDYPGGGYEVDEGSGGDDSKRDYPGGGYETDSEDSKRDYPGGGYKVEETDGEDSDGA